MFHSIVSLVGAFVSAGAVTGVAGLMRREADIRVWWDDDGFLIGSMSFVAVFIAASLFNF